MIASVITAFKQWYYPSHLSSLIKDLETSKTMREAHIKQLEYYSATVPMYNRRIERLMEEIRNEIDDTEENTVSHITGYSSDKSNN